MNSIARMYPNLSASELSNIILKGKGKSRKYFHHNPTQIPAGALEVDAVFAQSFTRHMVGEGTTRNAIQDRLFFFRSRNSPSLCVIECAKLIVIISRRRTMRKLIAPPEGDDEAEKCV